jgi:hypothetical protein
MMILLALTACSDGSSTADSTNGHESPRLDVELTRRWWQWAASEPAATNPVADTTGEDCHRGQPSDVFFLAGSFGTTEIRQCTVPNRTPILIPVLNAVCGVQISDCGFGPTASKNATLDGKALAIVNVVSPSPVTIKPVAGNPVFPDIASAVSVQLNGDWVLIPALEAGTHDLRVWGGQGGFEIDVTYHLVVA